MYYTHINRNRMASNLKHGTDLPVVRIQKGKYGKPRYATKVGFVNGAIEYKPRGDPILPCGARLVIVTEDEPVVLIE